jgi:hypothetical protein
MDPQTLRARIAELALPIESLSLSGDMPSDVREKAGARLDAIAADARRDILPAAREASDPDTRDDAARLFRRLAQSNSWLDGRDALTREWIDCAAELAASDVLRDLVVSEIGRASCRERVS